MEQLDPRMMAAIIAMMQQEQQAQTGNPSPGYHPNAVGPGEMSNPMPPTDADPLGSAMAGAYLGAFGGALGGPVSAGVGMAGGGLAGLMTSYLMNRPTGFKGKARNAYNNEYGPGNRLP